MKSKSVYIETSVISYMVAQKSRDLVVAAHQQITEEWWLNYLPVYHPYISSVVLDEISKGNIIQAKRRLQLVESFEVLAVSGEVVDLVNYYMKQLPIPEKALLDAYHIALATWHSVDFLITWNCTHIANGYVKEKLYKLNSRLELTTPTICTPEELQEAKYVERSHR